MALKSIYNVRTYIEIGLNPVWAEFHWVESRWAEFRGLNPVWAEFQWNRFEITK